MTERQDFKSSSLPPTEALLQRAPTHLFKSDHRSRVWRVDTSQGSWVIKRFEYSPFRQRIALMLGLHPGQRERRLARAMANDGLSVVPIAGHGLQPSDIGVKAWNITPYIGLSLLWELRNGRLDRPDLRRRATQATAQLISDLLQRGYAHRDLKTSNILVDEHQQLWLIDVGAVRRTRRRRAIVQMLATLSITAVREHISRAEQWRCLTQIVQRCPWLGDPRTLARQVMIQATKRAPPPTRH